MKVSELMQAMTEAGAPMEAILIAVKALEERDDAIEQRRAAERDRKRRQRAKAREDKEDSHGTVTGQSGDPSLSPSLSPQTPQTHPHTHPDNNTRVRKGRSKTTVSKPEGVLDQTWEDFVAHRKAVKAPLTATAMAGIEREAKKAGWSLEDALSAVVTRGWKSFQARFVEDERKSAANDGGGFLAHKMRQRQARAGP